MLATLVVHHLGKKNRTAQETRVMKMIRSMPPTQKNKWMARKPGANFVAGICTASVMEA
jgi:hypothetical protein